MVRDGLAQVPMNLRVRTSALCGEEGRSGVFGRDSSLRFDWVNRTVTIEQAVTDLVRGILPTIQIYLVHNEVRIRRRSHANRPVGPLQGA